MMGLSGCNFIINQGRSVCSCILWPSDVKSSLIWKDPDAVKDWGQEEKGTTEEEMVGWHHRLNGHGFGWTLGIGDGQGCLACCDSWGHKESDMTERLNWTDIYTYICVCVCVCVCDALLLYFSCLFLLRLWCFNQNFCCHFIVEMHIYNCPFISMRDSFQDPHKYQNSQMFKILP